MIKNLVIDDDGTYCRSMSNSQKLLGNLLTNVHTNSLYSIIVPSGMAAIATIINCVLKEFSRNKINLIISDEMYYETPELCEQVSKLYNSSMYTIDVTDCDQIKDLFLSFNSTDYNILFIESCSNPNGKMIDPNLVQFIKNNYDVFIIIDNTWLTHLAIDKKLYCDVVIMSLTKYYSGGKVIAGAVVVKNNRININTIYGWCRSVGYHVSPYTCDIILEAMSDKGLLNDNILRKRMENAYKNTILAINYIKDSHKVDHPYIKDCGIFIKYGPCVFTVYLKLSLDNCKKKLEELKYTKYETSFGHSYSTIDNFQQSIIIDGVELTRIRVSIGYESTEEDIANTMREIILLNSI